MYQFLPHLIYCFFGWQWIYSKTRSVIVDFTPIFMCHYG